MTRSPTCNRFANKIMTHHAKQTLQDLGYRLTPQRTMVWDVLREDGGHLSAEEICSRVRERFPNVTPSTVYRTLQLLVGLNLVSETCLGSERRYYEVEEEVVHHHLVCERCGHVEHLPDDDLVGLRAQLETEFGFHAQEATVFGICGTCLAQEETEEEEAGGHAHS